VSMPSNSSLLNSSLNAVDRTRTLVLTGGQGGLGQAYGETNFPGDTNGQDILGELGVQLSLGGNAYQSVQLVSRRSSVQGDGKWTVYVVEIRP